MTFRPRTSRTNYIQKRRGLYYYRRDISEQFQPFYGKTQWFIPLEGTTHAARMAEAGAIAHIHNKQMMMEDVASASYIPEADDLAMRLDMSPENFPQNMAPGMFKFWRDGEMVETYKVAISDDADYLRQAKEDGFFPMTRREAEAQNNLGSLRQGASKAAGDRLELNELKADKVRRDIDDMMSAGSDTLRSILPKMHQQNKPRETTKMGHYRTVEEFIAQHGNLPLRSITKRHVSDYVAHMARVTVRNLPISPTTLKQRLEKLSAILQFAASVDAVEYNVAKAVSAPKDTRPLGDQVYKPFTKLEVRNLIEAGTTIWSKRRYHSHKTKMSRMTDLITALHTLVWTGARPEEICQLRLSDIDLDQMGIVITNVSDGLDVRERMLKNEDSVRGVPIHGTLLPRLAKHMDHVREVSNSGLLFPSFEPETENGRYARPIGTDWSKSLREHVSDDPQKVLYSLRHSWAGESTAIGMSETMRNAIMGHASDSVSPSAKRYRHHFKDLENQLAWVNKMKCTED